MIYLFEQHYKHKVSQLKQEEQKIVQSLKPAISPGTSR